MSRVPVLARKLLSEAELLDNSSVSLDILLREIVKELLSVTYHLRKTSLRVEVLGVLLHVLGKAIDSIGKNSYLNLGRTGVLLVDLVLCDDGCLSFLVNHLCLHLSFYFRLKPRAMRVKSTGYARVYPKQSKAIQSTKP